MANFLAPVINDQQENSNGAPLSGGQIEVYLAGSSTPATTYSDQAGANPNTWPITLNTLGVNSQGAVWLGGGFAYKFIIKDSTGVVQRTIDNVVGINDSTDTLDQWVPFSTAPTYVSATSFTVAGDQRQIFQINRRVKTQNTGGTIYSTVTNATYLAPNTTVTVRNDSGVLDAGLSQVSYGLISVQNSSVTGLLLNIQTFSTSGTYTPTAGTTRILVELVGGGGGGGGIAATGAGQVCASAGGGAGGFVRSLINSGFSGQAYVIGAAGAGGVAGAAGGNGGNSTFMGLTAGGGGGGGVGFVAATSAATPGTGGTASGGTLLNMVGQRGTLPYGSFAGGLVIGGNGGNSPIGSGGIGGSATTANTVLGTNGVGFGGGGGGGAAGASQGVNLSSQGAVGQITIYEFA